MFVWYKLRKYPFWPSLVSTTNVFCSVFICLAATVAFLLDVFPSSGQTCEPQAEEGQYLVNRQPKDLHQEGVGTTLWF